MVHLKAVQKPRQNETSFGFVSPERICIIPSAQGNDQTGQWIGSCGARHFGVVIRTLPDFGRQRSQPPDGAGLITTFIRFTIGPGRHELPAGAGSFGVDGTADRVIDLSFQRDTTGILLIGAFHGTQMLVQILCQLNRDGAEDVLIALRPVKRRTKTGTARPTRKTRIRLDHRLEIDAPNAKRMNAMRHSSCVKRRDAG